MWFGEIEAVCGPYLLLSWVVGNLRLTMESIVYGQLVKEVFSISHDFGPLMFLKKGWGWGNF